MPSTINGIGTWYYGKDNVFSYTDYCPHCNRYVTLSFYDTREWIVVLFIPVIPLGRKRIFDSCPACSKHRQMSLKKYLQAKESDYLEADQKFQENPDDPDALGHLLQIFAAYQDLELFDQVAPQVHQRFSGNHKLLNIVGMINYQFGRMEQARDSFEQSLSIQADDEIRHMLGFVYTRLDEPDTAATYFQYIIDKEVSDKANALFALVEAYQAQGRHQEALGYLDHMARLNPQLQKEKAYKKSRTLSEKHQASGKVIKNKQITTARKEKTPLSGKTAWAILGAVGLAILLFFFGNAFLQGHQADVYLVNGLGRPYEVMVNGKAYSLSKNSHREITLPEGNVSVEVTDRALKIEPETLQLKSSFWTRPFRDRIYIINPDTIALIEWNKVYYHENVSKAPEPEWKMYYGESLYEVDEIDFPFKRLPDEITTSDSYGAEARIQIKLFDKDQIAGEQLSYMIEDLFGYESKVDYMKKALCYEPENLRYLYNLYEQTDVETFIETIRPGLDVVPVRVEWHRMYQTAMDITDPDYDLISEYEQRLDQMPDNPAMQYLYGRAQTDYEQGIAWFKKSIQGANPSPHGYYALGYGCMSCAEYQTAAEHYAKALELYSGNPAFDAGYFEALVASNQLDQAEAFAKKQLLRSPEDYSWMQEYTLVLRYQKKYKLADDEFQNWCKRNREIYSKDDFDSLKKIERLDTAYVEGDFKAFETISDSNDIYSQVVLMLHHQQPVPDDIIAKADSFSTNWLLLFYIAQSQIGKEQDGELFLTQALERLKRGGFEQRYIANCLALECDIDPDVICSLPMETGIKAIALTALGIRFPEHQERFFDLAQQLNFKKALPYHYLRSVHEKRPIHQSTRPADKQEKQI